MNRYCEAILCGVYQVLRLIIFFIMKNNKQIKINSEIRQSYNHKHMVKINYSKELIKFQFRKFIPYPN